MKKDCTCQYCANNIDEYFCLTCRYNFNECESFYIHKYEPGNLQDPGIALCPKCWPDREIETLRLAKSRIQKKPHEKISNTI